LNLIASARALFQFNPSSSDTDLTIGDNLAWSLTAFAHVTNPADDAWTNARGDKIQFNVVVESAMAILERATKRLKITIGSTNSDPISDDIHEFACAGTHLVYGLTSCLKFGHCKNGLPERMQSQFDVLTWRLENDIKLADAYYDALAGDYPEDVVRLYRLDTKLKFLGHAFEILNYAQRNQLFEPTIAQQSTIKISRHRLDEVIGEIASTGIEKYAEDDVLFSLLVGDACHAYHAVRTASE